MLPSDWRVCIYSFLIFFIQTQAETDDRKWWKDPGKTVSSPHRAERVVLLSERRDAGKEGDGGVEEEGPEAS